ncbi:DUF3263 domain-containing protein [Streptomyces ovatisporus]|uniref:DUF3263 domain-containing protein n=1 Tax=Streptomyces ovatisporus TaxID=1128682 RepID=A0ABV9A6N9_9ACTN
MSADEGHDEGRTEQPPGEPAVGDVRADPEPAVQGAADRDPAVGEHAARSRPAGLSARDVAVLALERRSWSGPGVKERAIREQLDMSPTRYYQLLNALLDDRHALAHDPVTVNRLRRRREEHRARR